MKIKNKKILFIVNIDSFFVSHRLPIALELIKKKYDVHLATQITEHYDFLVNLGIKVHHLNLSRSKINFFTNLKEFFFINKIIRKVKPDILHLITIKPILFGSFCCKFYKKPSLVLSISGMGYVYTDIKFKQLFIRIILDFILKFSLKNPKSIFIFQNIDDKKYYIDKFKLDFNNTLLIPGSGVDTNKIQYKEIDLKNKNILMACRLLKHKGVVEYIKAAEILKKHEPKINFYLAGNIDPNNPASINLEYIKKSHNKGIIIYLGWSDNIIKDIQNSNIIVLPSYREGMPKFLLEAAACGRPVITTNVPGCRDAITSKTGYLVEVKNSKALAESIKNLINNSDNQKKMSIDSRKLAIDRFDISKVIEAHVKIYNKLLI